VQVDITEASEYTVPGLTAGTYTVGFQAYQTAYSGIQAEAAPRWWSGKSSLTAANTFVVDEGDKITGIDATMTFKQLKIAAPTPTLSGSAQVGSTLYANVDGWSPGTTFAYEWFADGVQIAGASKHLLAVKQAQLGSQITVRVTGSLPGYTSVSKTSAPSATVTPKPSSFRAV
jgi:hypothetical protein